MKRWLKAALPPALAAGLVVTTLVMHSVQQPDPSEPSFLSPVSDADDGAAQLAGALTRQGVPIERRTSTPEAIAAATSIRGATLFIPAPEMVRPEYLDDLRIIPPSTRVVLVAPDRSAMASVGAYVPQAGPRWTAAAPGPGCDEPFATGPAAVARYRYAPAAAQTLRCYDGAVVEMDTGGPLVTLVGASDPFRNDRQGEWDNAAFAAGLLGRGGRVVWLDLHEREKPPPADPVPGEGDPYDEDEGEGPPGDSGEGDGDGRGEGEGQQPQPQSQQEDEPSLTDAFPPSFWAAALLLALALLAFAAASARRLGAPVAEPLPARVRAAETVRGLGGLYRRAGARDASLSTVQAAAVRRLAAHFGVAPELDPVCARVAAHLGAQPHEVRAVLGGPAEDTDEDLAAQAAAVQRLVRDILGHKGEQ